MTNARLMVTLHVGLRNSARLTLARGGLQSLPLEAGEADDGNKGFIVVPHCQQRLDVSRSVLVC